MVKTESVGFIRKEKSQRVRRPNKHLFHLLFQPRVGHYPCGPSSSHCESILKVNILHLTSFGSAWTSLFMLDKRELKLRIANNIVDLFTA